MNHETQHETDSDEQSFRQIFQIYDPDQTGSIRTEQFISITQNLVKENGLADQIDINTLVDELDPFGIGVLSYGQFKDGIKRLTNTNETSKANKSIKEDELLSDKFLKDQRYPDHKEFSAVSSPVSDQTFGEYDLDFSDKSSSLQIPSLSNTGKSNYDEEEFDQFVTTGIINEDQRMISSSKSCSTFYDQMSKKKLIRDRSFPSLPQHGMNEHNDEKSKFSLNYESINHDTIDNYEKYLESKEDKISELESHIKILISEKEELLLQLEKHKRDKSILEEKNNELTKENESIPLLEDKIYKLNDNNARLKEEIKSLNFNWNEEKMIFTKNSKDFQNELNFCKQENSKISQELDSIYKKSEECDEAYRRLTDDYNNLVIINKKLIDENETSERESMEVINECHQKIGLLEEQIEKMKFENQQFENSMRQPVDSNQQTPNSLIQTFEEERLTNLNIETINTKINHFFDDEQLVSSTYGMVAGSSLASEMETSSKDELMAKIRDEQQTNVRLRKYIDNILARIMEKSPELLEHCMNN